MSFSLNKIIGILVSAISSNKFLFFVITLFIIQAAWVAFSFSYPMLYDERYHFEVIEIFSNKLSPFFVNQPESYDKYGDLANSNTAYHYLMSFPYRLISLFTDNFAIKVIFLRIINIIVVAIGLVVFSKIFKSISIKKYLTNVSVFIFTLIPIVTLVAATINYDNMLFLLTSIFLLVSVRIIKSNSVDWRGYFWFVLVGCFAALTKSTFLPVLAIATIYIVVDIYKKYGTKFFSEISLSLKSTGKLTLVVAAVSIAIAIGAFSGLYLQNVVKYRTPSPSCEKTLGMDRCEANPLVRRNLEAKSTSSSKAIMPLPDYISLWTINMIRTTTMTGNNTNEGVIFGQPLRTIYNLVFMACFLSVATILYAWKSLRKDRTWLFLVTVSLFLTVCVFLTNYSTYKQLGEPFAIQPRYLLSLAPVIIAMAVVSSNYILTKARYLKFTIFIVFFLIITQGGGLVSHIILSDSAWNWNNEYIRVVNDGTRKAIGPFIKEWWFDRI